MQRGYHVSTLLMSVALLVVGLAMLVSALARGGGPLALGVVVGTLFTALGAARLWLALHADPGEEQ